MTEKEVRVEARAVTQGDRKAPQRPTRLTPEMAESAAARVAEKLLRLGHIDNYQFEEAIRDIARHGRLHMDGYQLGIKLDRYESWNCNLVMAEALDVWASSADNEIDKAQQAWAESNCIQPPFPVNARVVVRWGGADYIGTITEIHSTRAAKYAIAADGETGSRRLIVNFEDVRAALPKAAQ